MATTIPLRPAATGVLFPITLAKRELTGPSPVHVFWVMNTQADHNPDGTLPAGKQETIGGVLASALNMEDDISSGVYQDYMSRKHWPEQLDEEAFLEIRKRLTVLIEDTKKHKKILQALVKAHAGNE